MRVGVEDDGEERWRCTGVFLHGAAGGVDGVHRWLIVESVGNSLLSFVILMVLAECLCRSLSLSEVLFYLFSRVAAKDCRDASQHIQSFCTLQLA